MKQAIAGLSDWLSTFVGLLKLLVVFGVLTGILYDDTFGVIGNISEIMKGLDQQGLAGLVALVLLVSWYKPSS